MELFDLVFCTTPLGLIPRSCAYLDSPSKSSFRA